MYCTLRDNTYHFGIQIEKRNFKYLYAQRVANMTASEIITTLEDDHTQHGIEILYMREIGSRAFNLHSEASDHDAYVIFRQPPEAYAQVNTYKQNIRRDGFDDDWEVHGWNIKRFGELVYESNPTAMEFLNSSLQHYCRTEELNDLLSDFSDYAIPNANPIGLYYHYCSLAADNYEKYIQEGWKINRDAIAESAFNKYLGSMEHDPRISEDAYGNPTLSFGRVGSYPIEEAQEMGWVEPTTTERTVKRTLFIVRGICCGKWIRHNKTVPPLDFEQLLDKQEYLDTDLERRIRDLVAEKRTGNNHEIGNPFEEFIETELEYELDNEKYNTGNLDRERVNQFIGKLLAE